MSMMKMRADLDTLTREVEALRKRIATIESSQAQAKKGPGRPKKKPDNNGSELAA